MFSRCFPITSPVFVAVYFLFNALPRVLDRPSPLYPGVPAPYPARAAADLYPEVVVFVADLYPEVASVASVLFPAVASVAAVLSP